MIRRHFLRLLAAPLIARVTSLMTVSAIAAETPRVIGIDMATGPDETLLAVRLPCLGINPVYRVRNGVVVGQVHVASDDWADWRGDVVEIVCRQ